MKTINLIILFLGLSFSTMGQSFYKTQIYDPAVLSLQVINHNPLLNMPVVSQDKTSGIDVVFDIYDHHSTFYSYTLVHCDADWQPSGLLPFEYMEGEIDFLTGPAGYSRNTVVPYTHYHIQIPGKEIQLKLSGNYAVVVTEEGDPEQILLTACFSVSESLVTIQGEVTGNHWPDTDIMHQQVSFSLYPGALQISNPVSDLQLYVQQNSGERRKLDELPPSTLSSQEIRYERNPLLVFEGGNEYRKVEFLSHTSPGIGVQKIEKTTSGWQIILRENEIMSHLPYTSVNDQNGFYRTGCLSCSQPALEADYYYVRFSLAGDGIVPETVYLDGHFIHPLPGQPTPMTYDPGKKQYYQELFLKAGSYNYRYLSQNPGGIKTPAKTEGNHYQTENEYHLFVYYHPPGARYTRLVGHTTLRTP